MSIRKHAATARAMIRELPAAFRDDPRQMTILLGCILLGLAWIGFLTYLNPWVTLIVIAAYVVLRYFGRRVWAWAERRDGGKS